MRRMAIWQPKDHAWEEVDAASIEAQNCMCCSGGAFQSQEQEMTQKSLQFELTITANNLHVRQCATAEITSFSAMHTWQQVA